MKLVQAATAASKRREAMAAFMLMNLERDWDEWKPIFDGDPAGRRNIAKGHMLSRAVDNPNDIFIRVEFDSVEDARTFRERLLNSGVLDQVTLKTGPTIVEIADQETY